MASHRAISSLGAATRTNSVLTKPTGLAAGDFMIIVLDVENDVTPTPPASWVQLFNVDHASVSQDAWAWGKVATAGDAAATNFTVTHASTWTNGAMVAVQSAHATQPDVVSANNSGTGTTVTALGVTTAFNDAYVMFVAATFSDTGAVTPPSGTTPTFTERYDSTTNLYVADGTLATAGATGNKTITVGSSEWEGMLIAVHDSAATPGGSSKGPTSRRSPHRFFRRTS